LLEEPRMNVEDNFPSGIQTIYKSPTTILVLSFSLVHLHWESCPTPYSFPRPISPPDGWIYTFCMCGLLFFPSVERLGSS
jgi:hypothetical protein